MKKSIVTILWLLLLSISASSQVFVSDSTRRYSESKNEVIEVRIDTNYVIERSFKTITLTHKIEGITGVNSTGARESQWRIQIEKKSLPKRKGNVKFQEISGIKQGSGYRQLTRLSYDLVDRDENGDYESLVFTIREGRDTILSIFCHKQQ